MRAARDKRQRFRWSASRPASGGVDGRGSGRAEQRQRCERPRVATLLAEAAARGAAANVLMNLPAVGDPDFSGEMTDRVYDLVARAWSGSRRRPGKPSGAGEPRDPIPTPGRE